MPTASIPSEDPEGQEHELNAAGDEAAGSRDHLSCRKFEHRRRERCAWQEDHE